MSKERIDYSVLDPSIDKQRWNSMIVSTVSRALKAQRLKSTIGYQLLAWARQALAVAASVALMIGVGVATQDKDINTTKYTEEPALVLASWDATHELPSTYRVLQILGGNYGTN